MTGFILSRETESSGDVDHAIYLAFRNALVLCREPFQRHDTRSPESCIANRGIDFPPVDVQEPPRHRLFFILEGGKEEERGQRRESYPRQTQRATYSSPGLLM